VNQARHRDQDNCDVDGTTDTHVLVLSGFHDEPAQKRNSEKDESHNVKNLFSGHRHFILCRI